MYNKKKNTNKFKLNKKKISKKSKILRRKNFVQRQRFVGHSNWTGKKNLQKRSEGEKSRLTSSSVHTWTRSAYWIYTYIYILKKLNLNDTH